MASYRLEKLAGHVVKTPKVVGEGLSQETCAASGAVKNGQMLKGVRVIELATVIAAPTACAHLADLGAEVIKIESPSAPDMSRGWGAGDDMAKTADPKLLESFRRRKGLGGGGSAYAQINRGKKCILIDIQKPAGVELVKRLMSTANIFVTNVRSQSLQKLGLDYESVKDEFPSLIYGHFTAFGRAGPRMNDPGYDYGAFWANTGIMDLARSSEDASPARVPGGLGDNISGTQFAGWLGMALFYQKRTGKGQLVDATLFRAGVNTLTHPLIQHAAGNPWAHGRGKSHIRSSTEIGNRATMVTNAVYRCKDGTMIQLLGEIMPAHIKRTVEALGSTLTEFFGSEKPNYKQVDWKEATEKVDEIIHTKTYAEWRPIFKQFDVWHVCVTRFETMVEDEQVKASGMFVDVPGLQHKLMRNPIFLSADRGEPTKGAPDFGEDTDSVLVDLGLEWEAINKLRDDKVVA